MFLRKIGLIVMIGLMSVFLGKSAHAAPVFKSYGFTQITDNPATSVASQLLLTVSGDDASNAGVVFRIANNGPVASSVAEVYFDIRVTGLFGSNPVTVEAPRTGVSFTNTLNPNPTLPGGSNAPWFFSVDDGGQANNPAPSRGVNPGEYVDFFATLLPLQDPNDPNSTNTVLDVFNAITARTLLVGLHVISIPNGTGNNSNSFINNANANSTNPVPEPATAFTFISLMGGLAGYMRRKKA